MPISLCVIIAGCAAICLGFVIDLCRMEVADPWDCRINRIVSGIAVSMIVGGILVGFIGGFAMIFELWGPIW